MEKYLFTSSPALKRTDSKTNPFMTLAEYSSTSWNRSPKRYKSPERSAQSSTITPRSLSPPKARPKTPHANNNPLGRLSRQGYITPEWFETHNRGGIYTKINKQAPKKKHTPKAKLKASANKAKAKK